MLTADPERQKLWTSSDIEKSEVHKSHMFYLRLTNYIYNQVSILLQSLFPKPREKDVFIVLLLSLFFLFFFLLSSLSSFLPSLLPLSFSFSFPHSFPPFFFSIYLLSENWTEYFWQKLLRSSHLIISTLSNEYILK